MKASFGVSDPPEKKAPPKKKMGRPLKTVDNCLPKNWQEIILQKSSEGWSEVEIRAHLCLMGGKFCQKTWDAIKKRESDFLLTIRKAKELCEAWWIQQGRESVKSRNFQTGLWFINMKNRFGWSDKQETEITANIKIEINTPSPIEERVFFPQNRIKDLIQDTNGHE